MRFAEPDTAVSEDGEAMVISPPMDPPVVADPPEDLEELQPREEAPTPLSPDQLLLIQAEEHLLLGNGALAVDLLKKSGKMNNAEAYFRLGQLFEHGEGVKQSDRKARKWYRRAARMGHQAAAARVD